MYINIQSDKNNHGDTMISNYRIKDNVLYLYLDYNYEFGLIDLKNNIKQYIKDKKILFTGTTIALVVGGIVIGNININNDIDFPKIENNILYEYVVSDNVENTINIEIPEEEINNEIVEENKEEIQKETITNSTKYEKEIIENNSNNTKPTNIEVDSAKVKPTEAVKEQNKVVDEIDNNIYVTIYRNNGSVIKLELEEYLIGCVGAEMPALFNIEALKSQSIIARTYALKSIKINKKLTDTESTQSYKSNDELRNLWGSNYNTYYSKVKSAVESTKGEYLSYNGDYIEAVYHSTSNGTTESSTNVWENYYPYLISVSSEYDSDSPTYIQDKFMTYDEISNKLNIIINIETELNILSKTSGNRVEYISIGETTLKGIDFRNKLGLRSNDFDINKNEEGIIFTTRGYGHGVGMSQYGANGMAKRGYSYKDILSHYYPGTVIKNGSLSSSVGDVQN